MNATNEQGRVAWVTGASSGLGRAVSCELVRRGYRVAISARREELLEEMRKDLGEARVFTAPLDVTDREATLETVRAIEDTWGQLDIVFLNAGICEYLDVENFEADLFRRTMETNFLSMVYGVEAALPALRRSRHPHLIGMSSTVRHAGLPRAEAYGASKAACAYFMESLRIDLSRWDIPVSVISPGFVRTPLTDRNDFPMPMRMEPDRAAEIIVDGIEKQRLNIEFPFIFSRILRLLASLPAAGYLHLMKRTVRAS